MNFLSPLLKDTPFQNIFVSDQLLGVNKNKELLMKFMLLGVKVSNARIYKKAVKHLVKEKSLKTFRVPRKAKKIGRKKQKFVVFDEAHLLLMPGADKLPLL